MDRNGWHSHEAVRRPGAAASLLFVIVLGGAFWAGALWAAQPWGR